MYRSRDLPRKGQLLANLLERPYTKKTGTAHRTHPLQIRAKHQSRTAPAPRLPEADDLDAAEKLEMEMDADADVEENKGAERYEMDMDAGVGKSGDESAGSVRGSNICW